MEFNAHIFYKMERIVRGMCKQLGKQAEIIIKGEETEVNKSIIEHLGDSLVTLSDKGKGLNKEKIGT